MCYCPQYSICNQYFPCPTFLKLCPRLAGVTHSCQTVCRQQGVKVHLQGISFHHSIHIIVRNTSRNFLCSHRQFTVIVLLQSSFMHGNHFFAVIIRWRSLFVPGHRSLRVIVRSWSSFVRIHCSFAINILSHSLVHRTRILYCYTSLIKYSIALYYSFYTSG